MANSFSSPIIALFLILPTQLRIRTLLLLFLMVFSAIAEICTLSALIPFLSLITNPDVAWSSPIVQSTLKYTGFDSSTDLLIPITVLFTLAVVVAAAIRLANIYFNGILAACIGSYISSHSLLRILNQSISYRTSRNSATDLSNLTEGVTRLVNTLTSVLQAISASLIALSVFVFTLYINLSVSLAAAALLSVLYILTARSVKQTLNSNSSTILHLNDVKLRVLDESFSSTREILLRSTQAKYASEYKEYDAQYRALQSRNLFIGTIPRYLLECCALLFLSIYAVLATLSSTPNGDTITTIGILALASQRLLPAVQQIFFGWSTYQATKDDFRAIIRYLSLPYISKQADTLLQTRRLSIQLKDVCFRYEPDKNTVLSNINLSISPGERIGIQGPTGSGKSTLIDVLLGLLEPCSGTILVGSQDIHSSEHTIQKWHNAIAYVPQTQYIADSSILKNIVVPFDPDYSVTQLDSALRASQLYSYVYSQPNGVHTRVGEKGLQISGGQRQRLALARALYRHAPVLILDEATSALDPVTESSIMDSIYRLSRNTTVIMISHRHSTLTQCDRIYCLDSGELSLVHKRP